jgi:NADH-quinone oxidoreductase subunit N
VLGLALLLILAGLGFKISAVPFHSWAPDAYEGAPTPITALLSVASKAGGFAVLLRVLSTAFPAGVADWTPLLALLCGLTMTIGNVIAVRQSNVKRLLAYSSIAQAGYILMGVTVMHGAPGIGAQAVLIYLLAYLFMNLGAFAVVIVVSNALGSDEIGDYAGLSRRSPGAAAALTVFLLSLTGIPPLAGFIGKFTLFAAVIEQHFYALALIAAANSVVAAFYYFRLVRAMYLEPAKADTPLAGDTALRLAIALSLAGTVAIGLWPGPFLDWARAL